jgi:hypothetical protein
VADSRGRAVPTKHPTFSFPVRGVQVGNDPGFDHAAGNDAALTMHGRDQVMCESRDRVFSI